jgi:hypothetical protein
MKLYAQAPRDCSSLPCYNPITQKVNCNACPECCQHHADLTGWQGGFVLLVLIVIYGVYKSIKNKYHEIN